MYLSLYCFSTMKPDSTQFIFWTAILGQARWLILLAIFSSLFKRHRAIFSNPRSLWNKPSAAFMPISSWGTLSKWESSWYNLDLAASPRNKGLLATLKTWLDIFYAGRWVFFFKAISANASLMYNGKNNQLTNQKIQGKYNF